MLTVEIFIRSLSGILILAGLFFFVGWLCFKIGRHSSFCNSFEKLFWFLVIGLLQTISMYAIFRTGFRTVLLPVPCLVLLFIFKARNRCQTKQEVATKPSNVFSFFLVAVVVCFVYYLQSFVSWDTKYVRYVLGDNMFYARVAEYMNILGKENTSAEYIYQARVEVNPYHYGDIWLCAFSSWLLKIKSIYALMLVVYPLLSTIFVAGVAGILCGQYKSQKRMHIPLLISLFSFLFSGFSFFYPRFLLKADVISDSLGNLPKLLWVSCFLVGSVHLLKSRQLYALLSFVALAALSFVNILPTLFLAIALWALIFWRYFNIVERREILLGSLSIVGTLIFIFTFYKFLSTGEPVAVQNQGSLHNFLNLYSIKTSLNILIGGSFQFFVLLPYLILLLVVGFLVAKHKLLLKLANSLVFTWVVLLPIAGLISWALLFLFTNEAVQFFSNIFIPLTAIAIAMLFSWALSQTNSKAIQWSIVCLIGVSVMYNAEYKFGVGKMRTSDWLAIKKYFKNTGNVRFASLRDNSEFTTMFQKNTRVYQHLPILNYVFTPYINESLNAPFLQIDSNQFYKSYEALAISSTSFDYFIKNETKIGDTTFKEDLMAAFIMKKKISYVTLSKQAKEACFLPLMAKDSLPLQGEKIYKISLP